MGQDRGLDIPLLQQNRKTCRTIAFTSGKAGVGTSILVLNLAVLLAQLGKKVVVLDGDFGLGSIHVLLGCTPRFDTMHVVAGEMRLADTIFKTYQGVGIIPTPSGVVELANLEEEELQSLFDQLDEVEAGCDFLFIDTGPGIGGRVLSLIAAADEAFVVIRPEPTSLAASYGLMKIFIQERISFPFHLLLNMVSNLEQAGQVYDSITQIMLKFLGYHLGCSGFVLSDMCVPRSVVWQQPFVLSNPQSKAAICLRRIAHDLLGNKTQASQSVSASSMLKKILNRVWPKI